MKVETKKWIVMRNGKATASDFDVLMYDSREDALSFARALLAKSPEDAFTVQEWSMVEEVEVH